MPDQLNSHQFKEVYNWLGINLNKLGCVMLDLEPLSYEDPGLALYYSKNPERFWINGWVAKDSAHITLLYGLLESAVNYKPHIEKVLENWKLEEVEIDHIGYFSSPYPDENYYCLIAHIKITPELLEGHQRLEFLPHINTFSWYRPHMTIAYIDKEQGEEYRDEVIKEFNTLWMNKKLKVIGLNYGRS